MQKKKRECTISEGRVHLRGSENLIGLGYSWL